LNRSGREAEADKKPAGVVRSPGSEYDKDTQVTRRLVKMSLC